MWNPSNPCMHGQRTLNDNDDDDDDDVHKKSGVRFESGNALTVANIVYNAGEEQTNLHT